MPTILLLNDTRDHDNWGSKACAESLCAVLRDTLPRVQIRSVYSSWTTRRFRQSAWWLGSRIYWRRNRVLDRFSSRFDFLPVVADDFENVADDWLEGKGGPFAQEFLGKVRGSDVVLFNAEGSTYRNNSSAIRCLFALWLARTRLSIPALFVNGSVTLTVVDPILPAVARRSFSTLSHVAVREPCSSRNVQTFLPGIRVEVVPDSVFYLTQLPAREAAQQDDVFKRKLDGKPYFCFSLSMLLSMLTGYSRHGIRKTSLFALIHELKKEVPNAIILARDAMDQRICQELSDATGSTFFGPENTYESLLALLENASFIVSGRYHHLILATMAGCPAIALRTTSHKVDGLCELLEGDMGSAFDAMDLWSNIDLIRSSVHEYLLESDKKRRRLKEKARGFGEKVVRLGEMVKQSVESH